MALYGKIFSSEDYLQPSDLNDIENYLQNNTTSLNEIMPDLNIPIHEAHTWATNQFVYVDYIEKIETSVDNLKYFLVKPDGWIERRKKWNFDSSVSYANNFDYRDINRWYENLELIAKTNWANLFLWGANNKYYEWNENNTQESWEE